MRPHHSSNRAQRRSTVSRMSGQRHNREQRRNGAQMAARAGAAYAADQFRVKPPTVRGWCKEFGLAPAPHENSGGDGGTSTSSVDGLSLTGSSMAEAARDPDVALAHVRRLAAQCPESATDADELENLVHDLRLLAEFLRGHAYRLRYPDLARIRSQSGTASSVGKHPTVSEVRRKMQWRFGDDTEFATGRTDYENYVLQTQEWFWSYQISLPDGRVICDHDDAFEPRWRMLGRIVSQWAEATDDEVDGRAVQAGSQAHRDFLADLSWSVPDLEPTAQ